MAMTCTFHAHGTFCSHACSSCDRRMISAAERHTARQTARTSVLMRTKPNGR